MEQCIFCKIVKKEIKNYTVYEDDYVLAFFDINPHARGHTVVIPKEHVETVLELSEEDLGMIMRGARRAVQRIESVLRPDGYNIGWNDRPAGGQVVPHLHVHIMPRWRGDGGGSMHSVVNFPGPCSVADTAKLFVSN